MNETLNDFIIGSGTDVTVVENETLEQGANDQHNDFEKFVDSLSQNQVIENNSDEKIRTAVDNAVSIVENCMHDAILTTMSKVVIPRVEMAVRSITGSWGHVPNCEVQNPDHRDFLGNTGNTQLMSASSRLNLNKNQDKNDDTRNGENFVDGDFLALRPNYDRRAHAHNVLRVTFFL